MQAIKRWDFINQSESVYVYIYTMSAHDATFQHDTYGWLYDYSKNMTVTNEELAVYIHTTVGNVAVS